MSKKRIAPLTSDWDMRGGKAVLFECRIALSHFIVAGSFSEFAWNRIVIEDLVSQGELLFTIAVSDSKSKSSHLQFD